MVRLPDAITVERSERDERLRVRVRILTEGLVEYPARGPRRDWEFTLDGMERDVLRKVAGELDKIRLSILSALERDD